MEDTEFEYGTFVFDNESSSIDEATGQLQKMTMTFVRIEETDPRFAELLAEGTLIKVPKQK